MTIGLETCNMLIYNHNNIKITLYFDKKRFLVLSLKCDEYPQGRAYHSNMFNTYQFILDSCEYTLITCLKESECFNFYVSTEGYPTFILNDTGKLKLI